MTRQKSIYISKSDILICTCGEIRKPDEIIYRLSSYQGKSLKQFAALCSSCIKNNHVRQILKNSSLVFLSYSKDVILPSFLERIDNASTSH